MPEEILMTTATTKVTILFQPYNKTTRVPPGMSLFDAASWVGLPIDSACGAKGTCGKCRVRILQGQTGISAADQKVFSAEELEYGWRLSCRAIVQDDLVCEAPKLMGNTKAALVGVERHIVLDPNVHKIYLQLAAPTLADQRSDYRRIADALAEEGFDVTATLAALRQLPQLLRKNGWQVTAVVIGKGLVAIEPGDTRGRCYGLAFDIGTTTIVGALLDLEEGIPVSVQAALNQQAIYGADVLARITHAMIEPGGLKQLRSAVLASLNQLIAALTDQNKVSLANIYEVVIVGNPTMLHLYQGLDPSAIGVHPFVPVIESATTATGAESLLDILPEARVHTLPHLGAYVGADLVGGLLATGLPQKDGVRLLVDIGTNGEIVLGSAERTIATAAPAGPAFEGASIQDGMRASAGAIEAVNVTDQTVRLQVIGDTKPIGICGSGLIDAVAQLYHKGLLTASGRFIEQEQANRDFHPDLAARLIRDERGVRAFVLARADESGLDRPIVLSQKDIRELQFAKGAIASGIEVLMRELGITTRDLVEVYLAGSFGNHINPWSARRLGLVPLVSVERIKAVGNAAGEGAKIALLSFRERNIAYRMPDVVEYHELSGRTDFNDSFVDVLQFPNFSEHS
jgi:uncharacterized 2Fe-2S/4Fe-4S cluster protein (DUF4445 family)